MTSENGGNKYNKTKEKLEIERIDGILYEGQTKYTKQSLSDRIGVSIAMKTFASMGFYFKELPTGDIGIDGIVEPIVNGYGTGRFINCQIKSSESRFTITGKSRREYLIYSGRIEHAKYWVTQTLPVIFILVDNEQEKCYWKLITEESIEIIENGTKYQIKIPVDQILDINAFGELYKISNNQSLTMQKYYHLVKHKKLVNQFKDIEGYETGTFVYRFTVKGDGEATLDLYINDVKVDKEEEEEEWYFKWSHDKPLFDAVKQFFFFTNVEQIEEFAFKVTLNEIGIKFLELDDLLEQFDMQF